MGKIKEFWKKGKWQKIIIIMICMIFISFVGRITGIMYTSINEINVKDISVYEGEEANIEYEIKPDDYEVEILSTDFKVDDEKIATVKNNKIVGVSEGETTVQVIIKDDHENTIESNKAKVTVNLTEEQKEKKEKEELEEKRNALTTDEAINIKNYCEDIIKNILKAPSTAEFPGSFLNPLKDWDMVKKNNLVTVSSYVDAQNSFGAKIRSEFIIQIQMQDDGSGTASYVQFDGEVLKGAYKN